MSYEDQVMESLNAGIVSVYEALKNTTPNHLHANVLAICLTNEIVQLYNKDAQENADAAFEAAKTQIDEVFELIMCELNKAHYGEQQQCSCGMNQGACVVGTGTCMFEPLVEEMK